MNSPQHNPYESPEPPASPNDSGKRERWYDADPTSANTIGWLIAFPIQVAQILAMSLNQMADQLHYQQAEAEALKSIGADKVLSLYLSRQKRRMSDQNPELFTFLNRLKSLQGQHQQSLMSHTTALVTGTRLYLKFCVNEGIAPSSRVLEGLIDSYRRQGIKALENELRSVQATLSKKPVAPSAKPPHDPKPITREVTPAPAQPQSGMRSRSE